MKRMVSTKELSKEEWLRYRKNGLTGTDAGAIVGLNPYVSAFDVWTDKLTDEIDMIDSEAMKQGRDLEEYVAQRFTEETGLKVRRVNAICQNEEYPFMLADFDRLIVSQNAGLECKTVSPFSADKWQDGNIPAHYLMQVQHYLAVSGYDCWYIAALIYGKEFIINRINRDEELIQNLIAIEKRFWHDNVLSNVMPDPDGTKRCSEIISEMYFSSTPEKSIELPGFGNLLKRRDELDDLIEKLEKEKAAIEQKVKLSMEDASYATTDGYRISWLSSDSQRLDTKRLKEDYPELYAEYSKTISSRRFLVKHAA